MRQNLRNTIQQAPLFANITNSADRDRLENAAVLKCVPAGATILYQGRAASEIAIIVTGEARVCFTGQRVDSLRLHSGSLFGEMEYFETSPCVATVIAVTDCQLLTFRYAELQRLTFDSPSLAMRLNQGLLQSLAEKHRLVTDELIQWKLAPNVSHRPAPQHRPKMAKKAPCSSAAKQGLKCPLSTTIGNSDAIRQLRSMVSRVKRHPGNVLILGEPGVGKELVAKALAYDGTQDKQRPFVVVDSSTLAMSTVESILFGHEKGSFTGADRAHAGLFEQAHGGTIYFDEIGNMSLEVQAKLLRVIQEKQVLRLGAHTARSLDFRVISATNRDITEACQNQTFRYDLYSRISVFELNVPALRTRRDDVPLLVHHFLAKFQRPSVRYTLTQEAMRMLVGYDWPGNVRELQNAIQYAVAMAPCAQITFSDFPARLVAAQSGGGSGNAQSLQDILREAERKALVDAYKSSDGNISAIARRLNMDRSNLHKKLTSLKIHTRPS